MSYLGKSPTGTGVRARYYFTATGGETSLSGSDDNSKTLKFTDGEYVDVYLNGVSLVAGTDYNTSTANTIGGLAALSAGDIVEIVVYDIFTVADTVSKSNGGTFDGNVTVDARLDVDNIRIDGNTISSTNTNGDITLDPDGTGKTAIQGGDNNYFFGVKGGTYGLRYNSNTTSSQMMIEAVDDTLTASHEPLFIGGSTVKLGIAGTAKMNIDSNSVRVTYNNASSNSVFEINNEDTSGDANEGSQLSFNEGGSLKSAITSNFQTNGLIVYHEGANRLVIDSAGRILHGGITSNNVVGSSAQLQVSYTKNNEFGIHVRPSDNNTGGGEPLLFQNLAGNSIGSISANASNVAYNTSSDHRLKENVEDMTGAIARVKQLSPKRFSWIVDDLDAANVDGFLAHEAQTVVPEAVTGSHNQVDDGNAVIQGMDYSKIVPVLTAALKEAISKIETLETKVAALEAAE
jgi:hypothetical protein